MSSEEEKKVERPVWDRQDLDSFVRNLRQSTSSLPPALDELRRTGKFDENPARTGTGQRSPSPAPGEAQEDLRDGSREPSAQDPLGSEDRTRAPIRPAAPPEELPSSTPSRGLTALVAFLPRATVQRLSALFGTYDLGLLEADGLSAAVKLVESHRPDFVFTGLEFAPLHAPSLIAALKACPSHRALPVAVVTPQDPELLDLSFYRPDAILGQGADFDASVHDFVSSFRFVDRSLGSRRGPKSWVRIDGRILLAVASPMAQRIVGKPLHVAGADVTMVESATETMLVTASREFDLVLLDLEMPNTNVGDLIQFLRAALPGVPVVGVTSEVVDPAAGHVDAVLHKPLRRPLVFALCSRFLGRNRPPSQIRRSA